MRFHVGDAAGFTTAELEDFRLTLSQSAQQYVLNLPPDMQEGRLARMLSMKNIMEKGEIPVLTEEVKAKVQEAGGPEALEAVAAWEVAVKQRRMRRWILPGVALVVALFVFRPKRKGRGAVVVLPTDK